MEVSASLSPQLSSPEKRPRKLPDKFRDHVVQDVTEAMDVDQANSELSPPVGQQEACAAVQPESSNTVMPEISTAEVRMELPVKKRRGRPPKSRQDISGSSPLTGIKGSEFGGCALCNATLSGRSCVSLMEKIPGFTISYFHAIKEVSSERAASYLATSSGQLCTVCGNLAKNITNYLYQLRMMKARVRSLLNRQLARLPVQDVEGHEQEEDEEDPFFHIEDFLEDESSAFEAAADSQEAADGVQTTGQAKKRPHEVGEETRKRKNTTAIKLEKPCEISSVSFSIGEATWTSLFSKDPDTDKEKINAAGLETLQKIAEEFFKTCQLEHQQGEELEDLSGRCRDPECGLRFSLRPVRRHQLQLSFSGVISHSEAKLQPKKVCDYCGYIFGSGEIILTHMEDRHRDQLFHCTCSRTFTSRESRNAHKGRCSAATNQAVLTLSGNKDDRQPEGDATKEEAEDMPPSPRVVCETCRRPFASAKNLRDHMNIVHADHESLLDTLLEKYNFPCETCGKVFRKKSNLQSHILCHTSEKQFRCDQPDCSSTFKRLAALTEHRRVQHGPPGEERPTILCIDCGLQFHTPSGLRMHRSTKHPQSDGIVPTTAPCHICNKSFRNKSDLTAHMVVHTKEKLFECSDCRMKFTRKNSLQQHENIHLEKFRCETCDKSAELDGYGDQEQKLDINHVPDLKVQTEPRPQTANFRDEESGDVPSHLDQATGGPGIKFALSGGGELAEACPQQSEVVLVEATFTSEASHQQQEKETGPYGGKEERLDRCVAMVEGVEATSGKEAFQSPELSWCDMANVDLGAEETLETVQNMQQGEIIEANLVGENGEVGVPIRLFKGPDGSLNMIRDGKLMPLMIPRH